MSEDLSPADAQAETQQLGYTGRLLATEAWALVRGGYATLMDVRTAEEVEFA